MTTISPQPSPREDSSIEPRAFRPSLWPHPSYTSTPPSSTTSNRTSHFSPSFPRSQTLPPVQLSPGLCPSLRSALPQPVPLRPPPPRPNQSDLSAASTRAENEPLAVRDLRRVTAPPSLMDPWNPRQTATTLPSHIHPPNPRFPNTLSATSLLTDRLSDAPRRSRLSEKDPRENLRSKARAFFTSLLHRSDNPHFFDDSLFLDSQLDSLQGPVTDHPRLQLPRPRLYVPFDPSPGPSHFVPDRLHDDLPMQLQLPMPRRASASIPSSIDTPYKSDHPTTTPRSNHPRPNLLLRRSSSPHRLRESRFLRRNNISTPKTPSPSPHHEHIHDPDADSVLSALTGESDDDNRVTDPNLDIRRRAMSDAAALSRRGSFAAGKEKVIGVWDRVFRRAANRRNPRSTDRPDPERWRPSAKLHRMRSADFRLGRTPQQV